MLRWAVSQEVVWRGAEDVGVPHADVVKAPLCCDSNSERTMLLRRRLELAGDVATAPQQQRWMLRRLLELPGNAATAARVAPVMLQRRLGLFW